MPDSALPTPETPTHDCPIQGPGTPMSRTLNIDTGERGEWICIWCEMAKRITGGSR